MNYIKIPEYRIKLDGVATDGLLDGEIILTENTYWTATLVFENATEIYPDAVDKGSTVLVEVRDKDSVSPWNSGNWVTLFNGTVLYPNINFNDQQATVSLQCVGLGYALNMMNCAEEYGLQSRNPTIDSIQSILTDASVGVIPKWVNKYKNTAYNSGYAIDTTYVENLAGSMPFISAPWKPVDKFLDDLCDLHTAISQGSGLAGPHWIVDHSGYLRLKRIGVSQPGWSKYYGNSGGSYGLKLYLPLNEGTGTTAADLSGNNNTAAITATSWTTGKYINGLDFTVGSTVKISDSPSMRTTGDWTRSFWIYSNYALAGDGAAHDVWTERTTSNKFLFRLNTNGDWLVYALVNGTFTNIATLTKKYHIWSMVTVVKSGTNFLLYQDGAYVTTVINASAEPNDSAELILGNTESTCVLDEIRKYNRALSATEITALYNWSEVADATLVNGVDLFDGDFQTIAKQANVVVYHGAWRRPSSGDAYTNPVDNTEAQATWLAMNGGNYDSSVTADTTNHIVDSSSVRLTATTDYGGIAEMRYPYTENATWNLSLFELSNTPNLNFKCFTHDVDPAFGPLILLCTDSTNYYYLNLSTSDTWAGNAKATSLVAENDKWMQISLSVGPNSGLINNGKVKWQTQGSPNWNNINYIAFQIFSPKLNAYISVDGLHFGDANICRIARQEFPDEIVGGRGTLGTTTNPIRFKVITDNIGKDDTLTTADTGTMAQLTKAELLRLVSEPTVGKFYTPMIADVLPGQYFYIAKDWRIVKVTHKLSTTTTHFEVTDDVLNSHARLRYEDVNKKFAAIRPEWQDRQSSSLKSSLIDIRVTPLEKAYNI